MIHLTENPPFESPWGCFIDGSANSSALPVHLLKRNLKPNWLIFAPTGNETEETIKHLEKVKLWALTKEINYYETRAFNNFQEWHENRKKLPSVNDNLSHCAWHWKIEPMENLLKDYGLPKHIAFGHTIEDLPVLQRIREKGCGSPESGVLWFPHAAWSVSKQNCLDTCQALNWNPPRNSKCQICPYHPGPALKKMEQIANRKSAPNRLFRVCDSDGIQEPEIQGKRGCYNIRRRKR